MHRCVFAMSLGGGKASEESRLSIISTKEQREGKYEADGGQELKKERKNKARVRTSKRGKKSCN